MPRGEASLTRTDPVVGAIAGYVLANALDRHAPAGLAPARRCGVIRTTAVATRTTLLLVRYRYQLTLPGRYGDTPLIAEDARVLGFEGAPASAGWLADDAATGLLTARPTRTPSRSSPVTPSPRSSADWTRVRPEVNRRAQEYAAELHDAHRRVRRTVDRRSAA